MIIKETVKQVIQEEMAAISHLRLVDGGVLLRRLEIKLQARLAGTPQLPIEQLSLGDLLSRAAAKLSDPAARPAFALGQVAVEKRT